VSSWFDRALAMKRGRVICNRVARYDGSGDAGAFSNVAPMPPHPDNCHIIDVRGGINDPKHRFGGSFQLWIWKLREDGKVAMGRLGGS
jgi:hypothetical protein